MKKATGLIIVLLIVFSTFTVLPIVVKAQEGYPTIQDVGITFWSTSTSLPGPITATKGGHLRLWYFINNPNPTSMDVILGASIRDPADNEIHDPPNDKLVTVDPGLAVYSRFFEIREDAPTGNYDVAYGLWLPDGSLQIDLLWQSDWLIVTNPVPLVLSSSATSGETNIGHIVFDDVTYALPHTAYAETRMYQAEAIPPSGYTLDHWETSGQVSLSEQGFNYADIYVYGSGGASAVFRSSPTFDMELIYSPLEVAPGDSVTEVVYLTSRNGFSGWVDLSLGWSEGRPSWVLQDSFSEDPIYVPEDGAASTTLTISVDDTATSGTYSPEVFAISGSVTQHSTLILTVLKRYTVTFQLGEYVIVVDGDYYPGAWPPSVSFTWLSNEYHCFYMMSPFHMGFEGSTAIFREWNDGSKSNYRSTDCEGNIPFEDATYYPLYDMYSYFPVMQPSDWGGDVITSPLPGPYGWLWGTPITATAIPDPGMIFDHWTFRDVMYDEEVYYSDENPLYAFAGGPPVILTAYFSTPQPPLEEPTAVLTLNEEGDTFFVGDSVDFSGLYSYSPNPEEAYVVSYFFDFGDESNSGWIEGPTASHSYETPGTYYAKLKVIDNYDMESDWSAPIGVTVRQEGDFEVIVTPASQVTDVAESVEYEVEIKSVDGFNRPVSLAAIANPEAGLTFSFNPQEVVPPPGGIASSILTVSTTLSTPTKLFTISVVATSEGEAKPPCTVKLSVQAVLGVPYQSQDGTGWCGPTSLAMVLRYYGIEFHSWDYTDPATGLHLPSFPIVPVVTIARLQWYIVDHYGWLDTCVHLYTADEITDGKLEDDLRSYLKQGDPIILRLQHTIPIYNHFIVVTGCNESGIFINDPSGGVFDSPYLDMASVSNFNHAYISWGKWGDLHPYIPIGDNPAILTTHGPPDPRGGTLYFASGNIAFRDPAAPWDNYYFLDLDWGLTWKHWYQSEAFPDNVIESQHSRLHWLVYFSNSKPFEQEFDVSAYIVGEDGFQYLLPDKSISVGAYGRGVANWLTDTFALPRNQLYQIVYKLWNSEGQLVDMFESPVFYYLDYGLLFTLAEEQHHLYLHLYDNQGGHVGLDHTTNRTELGIPGAYYHDDQNGTITIVIPYVDDFDIVVDATYAEEPVESYSLSVSALTTQGVSTRTYSGVITLGESQVFTSEASEESLQLYAWQFIFKDPKRGTELRINIEEKYFQFIAPGKPFSVKYDPNMSVIKGVIHICYSDDEIWIEATAVDSNIDFCEALVKDLQTGMRYLLIDKPTSGGCSGGRLR